MDMRTFGKEFEHYYNRARRNWGKVHPLPDSYIDRPAGTISRSVYRAESGQQNRKSFDLVVLSTGLEVGLTPPSPGPDRRIDLNRHT